ncbi:hypothetical protein GF324_08115 [bacterium]|nr:hypothetical protein [bacterium]
MVHKIIKPFVEAMVSTMDMMVGLEVTPEEGYVKNPREALPGNICGIIGFAGRKVMGSVALFFTEKHILQVFEMMTGEEADGLNQDVADTVAELANIVAGNGKTSYASKGLHFDLAIPSVILGDQITISYGPGAKVVAVPIVLEGKKFYMEVMLKKVS